MNRACTKPGVLHVLPHMQGLLPGVEPALRAVAKDNQSKAAKLKAAKLLTRIEAAQEPKVGVG